jgi:TnpA family transposase
MKQRWTAEELDEQWSLNEQERRLLGNKTGPTRLGFVALLKYFQHEGRFPQGEADIPDAVVAHLARLADVPAQAVLKYEWSGRTIRHHRAQIRSFTGFRETQGADTKEIIEWLLSEVLPHDHHLEHLRGAVYQHCRGRHIEPPTPGRIDRLVRSALHTHEERLGESILRRITPEAFAHLNALIGPEPEASDAAEDPDADDATLRELRSGPAGVSLDSLIAELAKLRRIRNLGLPADLFDDVTPKAVETYRQRAAAEPPNELRRHEPPVKAMLVGALCYSRGREISDSLVDLLIDLVHRIGARAERRVVKELLADLRLVTGKTSLLYRVAEAAVEHPDGIVREVVYPVVGEETLRDLVREFKSTGPAYRINVQTHLRASYRHHYRRMLPAILEALEFRSNNALHRPVIEALELVKRFVGSAHRLYPPNEQVPIDGVVRPGWRELVVQVDSRGRERVDRINYEISVLQALRDGLRSKEIWVVGANRYRNPDQDLPADFEARREVYYSELNQPREAEAFVNSLRQQMVAGLEKLDRSVPRDPSVRILERAGGWISLSPLEAQPEPPNLVRLHTDIARRWPMTSLLDILKETDLRVGFTDCLTTVASHERLDRATIQKRLLLCLYGLGTNTGIKRIAAGDHGEAYADLRYVRRRFIRREQLRAAITKVTNATLAIRQPHIWGEGTTACASDSKKFGAWDQNLMTEWHIRYGGRGVMIYWHVERKALCIYSQLRACSSSEVAAMIEGLVRHCTDMDVERNYVDSHGQSEVAFAFCHLLGFQLLPRLKGIHAQKLYRPQAGQPGAYPSLQPVLTRPINWDLIANQYDEMVKFATALRVGTAETEAILRRFTRATPQHPTYQALAELGKVAKTVFLCDYLSSEALRREIHEGLNVVENWNSVNGFVFYGKGGEISTNQLDDQEIAALSLHLLQASLVYVNTLMIQRVLAEEDWQGRLTKEDLRGITPLLYQHVNPYGMFRLDMHQRLPIDPGQAAA